MSGLVCLFSFGLNPFCYSHSRSARTDAAGRYAIAVPLNSLVGESGKPSVIVTDTGGSAALPPAQTVATLEFRRKPVTLPDLRLWRGAVSMDPVTPTHRRLHVVQVPAAYGTTDEKGPTVELLAGAEGVWAFPDVEEDRLVDARVVEHGVTAIRAYDAVKIGDLPVTYRSATYALTGSVTPVSRGKACWVYGKQDALVPLDKCALTDGKLTARVDPRQTFFRACVFESECANPRSLRIDLGAVSPVSAVIGRGCVPDRVEVSLDGVTFAEVKGESSVVERGVFLTAPVPARYVRLRLSYCLSSATELAVFAPV
jgi:hypothetical protein